MEYLPVRRRAVDVAKDVELGDLNYPSPTQEHGCIIGVIACDEMTQGKPIYLQFLADSRRFRPASTKPAGFDA